MTQATLNFPRSEYDRRIALARAAMAARGIDLLISSDPSNMAWLTGYDGWSFYVHQAVLLSHEGEPVWWGRKMDGNGAVRTAFMDAANITGYPDHYVQSTERHPMDHLSALIAERGWNKGIIGVEMDNYWFTAAALASLKAHLTEARFADATGLVNWQRAVKSDHEIEFMRRAARIVEKMHTLIFDMVEPGLKKNVLVAELYKVAIEGADGHWGDYPAIVPMLPSGIDATAPHLTWDDRAFKKGEGTFFEIAGCYRRYHCPLSRTVYLGTPPQRYLDAEKAVLAATDAGLEKALPGNTCEDVAIAFFDTLQKARLRQGFAHRLFHRPLLPARLGRAHHVVQARRQDGAQGQHDAALHARLVARGRRPRTVGIDPHHRQGRRTAGQCPPPPGHKTLNREFPDKPPHALCLDYPPP